jgi:beta-lactamase class A
LPLAIAYFKWVEIDPSVFDKELLFSEDLRNENEVYQFSPKLKVELGKAYKVAELIERMIVYSDNDAKTVLLANIDQDFLIKVYSDLGVVIPNADSPSDFMSAKEYSSFYRVLYNASYLNRSDSNKLLEILARADFKNGLLAGLPADVIVAHKFGERGFASPNNFKQLHDCGIIYHSKHPYILCVMTRGQDYDELAQVISGISKIVYENIKD